MGSNPMGNPYLMSSVCASDSFEVVFVFVFVGVGVVQMTTEMKEMKLKRKR